MQEIVDLYDINRNLTGKTMIRGDKVPEGLYRMVVHICIFNSNEEMLIQHRHPDIIRWPNYWDVSVGGGASKGDDSRQAAQRELKEELGLDMDFSEIRPMFTINFSEGFDDFYIFTMDVKLEDLHLQEDEVCEAKWATCEEIEAMIDDGSFIPYEKDLLRYMFYTARNRGTWDLD